ncbi:MAG: 3TM-type holin [Spirochaetota bacterium]|nr:3TM-type holin [Spirochaetota bacterium]
MAWYNSLLKFFSSSSGGIIDSIADSIDRFVTTDEEKTKLRMELQKLEVEQQRNSFEFQQQMQELIQKRESEIEQTIRSELEAKSEIMLAELRQDDKYTKRARPTVVYVGLIFILLEIFGLRHIILSKLCADNFGDIIKSSDSIFKTFLIAWSGVIGVYSIGRSAEKRGLRGKLTSLVTGEIPPQVKLSERPKIQW